MTTLAEYGVTRQRGQEAGETYVDQFTATVEYRSDQGRSYADEFILDMEGNRDSVRVDRNGVHELTDRVEKLTQAVQQLK